MKLLQIGLILAAAAMGTVSLVDARPLYQVKCPSGYTLKKDALNPEWFQCDKAGGTQTAATTCPSGTAYEARDGLNKDRCVRTTTSNGSMHCELRIGDDRDNWAISVRSDWDKCEHKTKSNKDEREVKCDSGFDPVKNGSGTRDTCVKKAESYSDPSCPSGYSYKSQGGRDICEKSSGTETVKPVF